MVQTLFTVTNDAELSAVISAIDVGGAYADASTADAYTIMLAAPGGFLGLSANLPAINLGAGDSLTIEGQHGVLSGSGVARGFYVYSGTVLIRDLVVGATVAKGGDGAAGVDGGGGGAGLGAGLFIAQGASVTLDDVQFAYNTVIGGNGGASVNPGGLGAGSDTGAAGAFGNGGSGGGTGGGGGFGAGGGGGAVGGAGGFGGGNGGSGVLGAGGGGGLAAGADIFVHAGGVLVLQSGTFAAGTLIAGTGASGGGNGLALGSAIFLTGNQPFTMDPAAGETLEIDGVIADTPVVGEPAGTGTQTQGGAAGFVFESGGVDVIYYWPVSFPRFTTDPYVAPPALPPAHGTVVLNAVNTYSSGTIITGTLELGNASAAGTGAITFTDKAGLVLRVHGTTLPANWITGLQAGDVIELPDISSSPALVSPVANTPNLELSVGSAGTLRLSFPSTDNWGALLERLAVQIAPDGHGGTQVSIISALHVTLGQTGFLMPFDNTPYIGAALSNLSTNNFFAGNSRTVSVASPGTIAPTLASGAGGAIVLHQSGTADLGAGYTALVSDSAGPVSVTGGDSDGQTIIVGNGGLNYTAGAGTATVIAAGGDNTLFQKAGAGDQVFLLGTGADTIFALSGNATVDGNAGGKLMFLGGNDVFIGHADSVHGADTVVGMGSAATVSANGGGMLALGSSAALNFKATAGSSTLLGGTGAVTLDISGGTLTAIDHGIMNITATGGASYVVGAEAGSLVTFAATSSADATLVGGAGSMIVAGQVNGLLLGGAAGGNAIATSGSATIIGGGDGDVLTLAGKGSIIGGAGAETLVGLGDVSGNIFLGGSGPEVMRSGTGGSLLIAGAGDTSIDSNGRDTIVAGAGAVTVQAHGTGAQAYGGSGALTFLNGGGASTVMGAAAMTVSGGDGGGFYVAGSAGGSLLMAGAGNATLVGGGNGDVLQGGSGYAFLLAGPGAETLQGGSGFTVFTFQNGTGGDKVVTGWDAAHDAIALRGFGDGPLAGLTGFASAGGDMALTLADGTHVTFVGTPGLGAASFI
jgi:hypothetical protein